MNSMEVSKSVRAFYERFPYPHYPLLAKPRWQEGALTSSMFAQSMFLNQTADPAGNILCLGSGEILPYVLRKWELPSATITCVDSSERSISRARVRMASRFIGRNMDWIRDDIDAFLNSTDKRFSHVDAYGVLHHLSDPAQTMQKISEKLRSDGTIRLMVYNKQARGWIWEINRLFHTLKLNPLIESDLQAAKNLLTHIQLLAPMVRQNLQQMGQSTLKSNTRFVDTFMHPHELRVGISRWFDMIDRSGLKIVGLFDRYAELDDLKNPMWNPPTRQDLEERAADLRFENNLEIFLTKKTPKSSQQKKSRRAFHLLTPPKNWFEFRETKALNRAQRSQIWNAFLMGLNCDYSKVRFSAQNTSAEALSRLARCGAIHPHGLDDATRDHLTKPLSEHMEAPTRIPAPGHQDLNPILLKVQQISKVNALSETSTATAKKRLVRLLFEA